MPLHVEWSDESRASEPDFELEKYAADRVHELELNKFSHALEVERLKILLLLNGGAFTIVVGFSEALAKGGKPMPGLAFVAILAWIAGLAAAAWATQCQLNSQSSYSKAYNNRRRAVEWRRLPKEERRLRMGSKATATDACLDTSYDSDATDYRDEGGKQAKRVATWGGASVLLFLAGALVMTFALSGLKLG